MINPENRTKYLIRIGIYLVLFVASVYALYTRYFLWIDCFNELGRCYDPDGSKQVYTTSGQMWAFPAVVFLILGVKNLYQLLKKNRN
jgi:hypothetical protein